MLALEPSEAHFWLCKPDELEQSPEYIASMESVLNADELARMRRFKFPQHSNLFCISHAFTRYVLSLYAPLKPAEWNFSKGEHGKPYVNNAGFEDIYFSLSHTKGLIALFVAKGHEIGCDVEGRKSNVRGRDIAKRFFSSSEVEEYMAFDEQERQFRFFDYWSLKESYIKAKGKGLAISLGKFSFSLNHRPIAFSADEDLEESGVNWTFQLLDVGSQHVAAIATRQTRPMVRHWQACPLMSYEEIVLPQR